MLAKKHIESWDHGWCWPSNSWILPCWDYLSRGVVKFNHLNLRPMCLWVSMKIGDNHGTLKLPGKIMITSHGCWIFTVGCWIRIIEMPRPVIHYVQKNIDVIPWHTARATLIGGLRNMAFIFHFIYGIILPISFRGVGQPPTSTVSGILFRRGFKWPPGTSTATATSATMARRRYLLGSMAWMIFFR